MQPEQLRKLLRRRPFQPFRIYVSNGASYDVTHPEAALVVVGGVLIRLPPTALLGGPRVDRNILISFIHITHVEVFLFGEEEGA